MAVIRAHNRVGLFPMCADILHAGHIFVLEEAKKNCDYLIVALNTHPDGKSPVQSVFERYTQLLAVEYVDEVIPYQGRADMEILASVLEYDVRFLGSDYNGKEWDGKEQETIRGIPPHFIKRDHKLSSSELKSRILNGPEEKCTFYDKCFGACEWCETNSYSEACVPMLFAKLEEQEERLPKSCYTCEHSEKRRKEPPCNKCFAFSEWIKKVVQNVR